MFKAFSWIISSLCTHTLRWSYFLPNASPTPQPTLSHCNSPPAWLFHNHATCTFSIKACESEAPSRNVSGQEDEGSLALPSKFDRYASSWELWRGTLAANHGKLMTESSGAEGGELKQNPCSNTHFPDDDQQRVSLQREPLTWSFSIDYQHHWALTCRCTIMIQSRSEGGDY